MTCRCACVWTPVVLALAPDLKLATFTGTDEYGDPRESISIRCRCSIDCRTYNGPQPKEQETDQHDSCVGDGEFNWRFLFSRIQVTKGVPIDCFLHLSVWEYFALSRPIMLCESLLELKSYVKKVSEAARLPLPPG